MGLTFPVVLDPYGSISNVAYEVRGLPTTIFVAANGVVSARHVGPLNEAAIDTYLGPLLEQRTAQAGTNVESEEDSTPSLPLAPDFTLAAANGDSVSLQDYRDKQNVILVFYQGKT